MGGVLQDGFVLGIAAVVAAFICVLYVAALVWVYRDADSRGKSGGLVAFVVLLMGPAGLIAWLVFRPDEQHGGSLQWRTDRQRHTTAVKQDATP